MTTSVIIRNRNTQNQVVDLGDAHHAARALHFLKAEHGVGVVQQHFDDDGEAQRGNAEIVGTQRQHRQAEEVS